MGKHKRRHALEVRTADGDHSVSIPESADVGLTDDTWTSVFADRTPPIALDRAGILQTYWGWGAQSVLSIPAAWKAMFLVAQTVSSMPVGAWRGLQPLPMPNVLAEPYPGENRVTTIAAWVQDLLLHGNCFAVLGDRDSRGYVSSLIPVPADQVSVSRVDGRVRYIVGGPESAPDLRLDLGREDVLHCKGLQRPGDLRGQGVLERHLVSVEMANAMTTYASTSFRSGVPSGVISLAQEVPDQEAAKAKARDLKAAWMAAFGGASREPAVLTAGITYTPLSWSPEAMQIEQLKQLSDRDMARIFGVPAYWVDAPMQSSSLTYSNLGDNSLNLLRFSLEMWCQVLESELSRLLPRGTDARMNRDAVLRPSFKERAETYAIAAGAPWMLPSEVRADEGLMPLPVAEQITQALPLPGEPVSPGQFAPDQQTNAQATTGG